jgi:hypothetical protein
MGGGERCILVHKWIHRRQSSPKQARRDRRPSPTHHADLIEDERVQLVEPLGVAALVHAAEIDVLLRDAAAHGGMERGAWLLGGRGRRRRSSVTTEAPLVAASRPPNQTSAGRSQGTQPTSDVGGGDARRGRDGDLGVEAAAKLLLELGDDVGEQEGLACMRRCLAQDARV